MGAPRLLQIANPMPSARIASTLPKRPSSRARTLSEPSFPTLPPQPTLPSASSFSALVLPKLNATLTWLSRLLPPQSFNLDKRSLFQPRSLLFPLPHSSSNQCLVMIPLVGTASQNDQ